MPGTCLPQLHIRTGVALTLKQFFPSDPLRIVLVPNFQPACSMLHIGIECLYAAIIPADTLLSTVHSTAAGSKPAATRSGTWKIRCPAIPPISTSRIRSRLILIVEICGSAR